MGRLRSIDELLSWFTRARASAGGWTAACPAHDDRENSLSITVKGERVLLHCFAGCTTLDIMRALNRPLTYLYFDAGVNGDPRPMLTLEDFAAAKHLPVAFLAECGIVQEPRGLRITYCERDGQPATRQRRRTAIAAKDGSFWDGPRGEPIAPYGRWRLDEAIERGEILLVEGETDALTAWYHHVPCLGIPGADLAKVLTAEDLAGIERVYVVQEPDRGGETFVAGLARRLDALRWPGAALAIQLPVKDLNELHVTAGDAFARQLEQAKATATPLRPPEGPAGDAARPDPLHVLSWADMLREPIKPIAYHWPGWVARGALTIVAGTGESLKSWLCLYLASMTAAGQPALAAPGMDAPPVAQGPVVYLSAENAIDEERRRCQLLRAGLQLPDDLPITFVAAERLSFARDEDYDQIVALIQRVRPGSLFLDSAIALSGIPQENDNALVRAFLKDRILPFARRYGITTYLIVHSPKLPTQPGSRFTDEHVARGASDWRNAADVVLYLRRDASLGQQAVVLRHAKQRIGPRHQPVWFSLEDVEPGQAVRLVAGGGYHEESGQGASPGLVKAIGTALDTLKATPGGVYRSTAQQALTEAKVAKATARRALDVLRAKAPWPHGPLRGRKHAVVTEDRHGKHVFLTFLPDAWPGEDDLNDA